MGGNAFYATAGWVEMLDRRNGDALHGCFCIDSNDLLVMLKQILS